MSIRGPIPIRNNSPLSRPNPQDVVGDTSARFLRPITKKITTERDEEILGFFQLIEDARTCYSYCDEPVCGDSPQHSFLFYYEYFVNVFQVFFTSYSYIM